MRGRHLQVGILAFAGAVWTLAIPCAHAQVRFDGVAHSLGLHYDNPYGQTFDFPNDRWIGPAMMRAMQAEMGSGAAVGDFDRDGDPDVYLLGQYGVENKFYRNDVVGGPGQFTDITVAQGLADYGFGRVAAFADLDNDGWQDLLLLNDDEPAGIHPQCKLFKNNAGNFADVTAGSGFTPAGHIKGGLCLGDYDSDGLLDVYVPLWLLEAGTGQLAFDGHNKLLRNLGNLQFQDVTLDVGLGTFQRDSFSCVFADFDNDGDSDLYVAVDHTSDVYYRNEGGTFVDDTLAVGTTHTGNDMGISVADFDNDGDLDVYSTNITDPLLLVGTTQFNTLLVNQLAETGTFSFVDEAAARGVRDTYWGWGTEFVDVDNDADLDLYAVNGFDSFLENASPGLVDTPEVLFINDGTGHFSRLNNCGADFVGDARGAIAFDYDRDGDQDFLVTVVNEDTVLLENVTAPSGHWLDVDLVGGCSVNADGIGARVHLGLSKTSWFMREILGGGSYLSGRPHEAHFGLGAATLAAVVVDWPDGTSSAYYGLSADRRITVHRLPGDLDRDGFVRLFDFAGFQRCFGSGRAEVESLDCSMFDFNLDGDIDDTDYVAHFAAFNRLGSACD